MQLKTDLGFVYVAAMGLCCGKLDELVVAMTTAGRATFSVAPYVYKTFCVLVCRASVAVHGRMSPMRHSFGWKYFWYTVLITASNGRGTDTVNGSFSTLIVSSNSLTVVDHDAVLFQKEVDVGVESALTAFAQEDEQVAAGIDELPQGIEFGFVELFLNKAEAKPFQFCDNVASFCNRKQLGLPQKNKKKNCFGLPMIGLIRSM